jgi:hypothetical protein
MVCFSYNQCVHKLKINARENSNKQKIPQFYKKQAFGMTGSKSTGIFAGDFEYGIVKDNDDDLLERIH